MSTEITVEESEFSQLVNIEPQYDSMRISNSLGVEIDADAFIEHLRKIEGMDRIRRLIINYNSTLTNLNVLCTLSELRILHIYGQNIKTFEGIEWFDKGEYILIETIRNKQRDISRISKTQVKSIDLFVERLEDLSAIADCRSLTKLDLNRSMEVDFTQWRGVPFEFIGFRKGKFKELGNIAAIPDLKEIYVLGCRSLERFTGDNSSITRIIVDGCKKLDLRTLKTFEKIETLIVNSCPNEMNLCELTELKFVKHIDFILCNVQVDLVELKSYFPNLESLHVSRMKKEYGIQLKQLNPDIEITGNSFRLE